MDSPEKNLTLDFRVSYLRGRNPVNPYEPTTGQSVQASMEPRKIEPMPPDPIPVNPPNPGLPHDGTNENEYLMKEKFEQLKQKTLIRKRPLLTMAFTVIAFILSKILGIEADLGQYIDVANGLQLGELIWGTGSVIAAYFWDRKDSNAKPSQG